MVKDVGSCAEGYSSQLRACNGGSHWDVLSGDAGYRSMTPKSLEHCEGIDKSLPYIASAMFSGSVNW